MSKLRVMELFSGYGSQRMALRNLGIDFESVGISEIDIPAILSYASIHDGLNEEDKNFEYPSKEEMLSYLEERNIGLDFKTKKVKLPKSLSKIKNLYRAVIVSKCFGDVSLLKPEELPDMDLLTYSFPCTDISVAGKQEGIERGQTRSGLLYECEKIIDKKLPKYLLLENVKNLVGKNFKNQFDEWLKYLNTLGYTNYWKVLNAKDYGVPQNRERVFVVSILNDENKNYSFPEKQPLTVRLKDVLESQVDEKYYLSDEVQARFKPNKNFEKMNANIVGTTAPDCRTIGQRDVCYHENSIMGSLVATDYKQPKQLVELNKAKQNAISVIQQLYDTDQLTDNINTCDLSVNNPKVKDIGNCITARYDAGVSNQKSVGIGVVERVGGCFDPNIVIESTQKNPYVGNGEISPTLTSSMGTGGGHIPMIGNTLDCEINVVGTLKGTGNPWDARHESICRVYGTDGISPTVTAGGGGGVEPKVMIESDSYSSGALRGRKNDNDEYEQRLELLGEEAKNTITTVQKDNVIVNPKVEDDVILNNYRIRKLTPLECWRLMGCSDEDFYKAQQFNSDSQLYKQAGNSIVVNVLEGIFEKLLK